MQNTFIMCPYIKNSKLKKLKKKTKDNKIVSIDVEIKKTNLRLLSK